MSGLTLRLQKYLEEESATATGAVATLRRVTDETGKAVRGELRLEVRIPASDQGEVKRFDVKPGRWLVEATLPSGEILTEEVAVPSGEDVPVTLHASEHSPHEWLGWQHLLGNIEGEETLKDLQNRARKLASEVAAKNLPKDLDPSLSKKIAGKIGDLGGRAAAHLAREYGPFLRKYKVIRPAPPAVPPEATEEVSRAGPGLEARGLPEVPEADLGQPTVGLSAEFWALRGARAWKEILDLSHDPFKVCPVFKADSEAAF